MEELAGAFMVIVGDQLDVPKGERDWMRVFEVLNGLAIAAGVVVRGTGADEEAVKFFLEAFEGQLGVNPYEGGGPN